ncbi:hypothetical protein V6N11_038795 [Hibiscus sabdariffa]|uniref:Uncharacterized protein n=1 Tax=Hibiscus sabdariffa TaxID=183260 RepID=A0ABR2SLX4_9ROSI
MARIDYVVFSLALILSVQMVVSEDTADSGPSSVGDVNEKEDDKVTTKEVKKDISDGLQDAVDKGVLEDKGDTYNPSASPQQEEEYLMKIFFQALMKMADEGKVDSKVLKKKLFPGEEERMDPKIEPEVIQALREAMRETQAVEEGAAAATPPMPAQ